MTFAAFTELLRERIIKRGDGKAEARCPGPSHKHDDRRPSLSIGTGVDGRVLIKCHAGCPAADIVAALGITMQDLAGNPTTEPVSRSRIVATYSYQGADGEEQFQICRLEPKSFRVRRRARDGETPGRDGYVWKNSVAPVVYRLPQVRASIDRGAVIYVAEGERDCDSLAALGVTATTNPFGAGKWKPDHTAQLHGAKRVVIVADADQPGRNHAKAVAASLASAGISSGVIELPGSKDASDWITSGGTREQLEKLVEGVALPVATRRLLAVLASEVTPERVIPHWGFRIPKAKVTEIIGEPGSGKSTMTMAIAAATSRGGPLPGTPAISVGAVLIFSAEDGVADTIVPRLIAHGADLNRVEICTYVIGPDGLERLPTLPDDVDLIEAKVKAGGALLVIIDPLSSFLSRDLKANNEQDARIAMTPLAGLAQRTGAVILVVRHPNKSTGTAAISRAAGSGAFTAAARSSLVAGRDQEANELALAQLKSNLGPPEPALAYRIVGHENGAAMIEWLGESDATADQLFSAPKSAGEKSALDGACQFLTEQLADGPVAQQELFKRAKRERISEPTLRRAKKKLKILSDKEGEFDGGWLWELPKPKAISSSLPTPSLITFDQPHPTTTNNNRYIAEGDHEGDHDQLEGDQDAQGDHPGEAGHRAGHDRLRDADAADGWPADLGNKPPNVHQDAQGNWRRS
jgi:hypothetical protein